MKPLARIKAPYASPLATGISFSQQKPSCACGGSCPRCAAQHRNTTSSSTQATEIYHPIEGALPLPLTLPGQFGTEAEPEQSQPDFLQRPFGPLPYREATEMIRELQFTRNFPIVNVTTEIPAVTLNHTLSSAQINQISSRSRGGSRQADNAGLTRARLAMQLQFTVDTGTLTNGSLPVWLMSVNLKLYYRSITQWIANEYPRESCEYRETVIHEDEHVRVDREILEQYAPEMRSALIYSFIPTQDNPIFAASRDVGEQQIQGILVRILQPVYQDLRRELYQANNDLDTPAHYQQVYERCSNW